MFAFLFGIIYDEVAVYFDMAFSVEAYCPGSVSIDGKLGERHLGNAVSRKPFHLFTNCQVLLGLLKALFKQTTEISRILAL